MCSRRGLIIGAIAASIAPSFVSAADTALPCGCDADEFTQRYSTRASKSGDNRFDAALVEELKFIKQIMPSINPGFQFVKAHNAFTTRETVVLGTDATVWIGIEFVHNLIATRTTGDDGGIAVAGVLAHECAHVHQLASNSLLQDLRSQTSAVLFELHADFLAGFYLARKRNVTPEKLTAMQRVFAYTGTTYDRNNPKYHGTPGLRGAAMDSGYFAAADGKSFMQASEIGAKYVRGLV